METEKYNNMDSIELNISAEPENLSVARAVVRQAASITGVRESETESVTLALVEALTNVIRHSYDGPCKKPININFSKINCHDNRSALEITVRDHGKQVDPDSIKGRDLEDIKPGGVGVHIIKTVMDHTEYNKAGDCGMQLRMLKYID